jgi:alpha-tubulin suppressor-like RCC1 family protein
MFHSTPQLVSLRKCLQWLLAAIAMLSLAQLAMAQPSSFPPKIAAGTSHSVTLLANGVIATHGENRSGEIGDGTTTTRLSPYFIPPPTGKTWAQVATGDFRTTALTSDGLMYSWGSNGYRQIDEVTLSSYLTPKLVTAPTGKQWSSVSAGYGHTLALCTDGTLYTWGANHDGQLGTGIASPRGRLQIPAPASGQTWVQVAAGYNFSLALCSDGSLYAWGDNDQGQLDDGTTQQQLTPVRITPPSGQRWTRITAGFWNSAALCSDGLLYM